MHEKFITVAEDDADLAIILQLHLKSIGYPSVNFSSIGEATSFVYQKKSGLLLIDNHLTDGIAIDYVGSIKNTTPGIPIILMTADYIEDLVEHENYCFLDGLLLKPFAPESLNAVIEKAATQ